jgi:hypothetical protein
MRTAILSICWLIYQLTRELPASTLRCGCVAKIRWFSIIWNTAANSWHWLVALAQITCERIQALRIRVNNLVNLRLCMKVTSQRNRAAKRTRQNCTSCLHNKHASRQTSAKLTTRYVKISSVTWVFVVCACIIHFACRADRFRRSEWPDDLLGAGSSKSQCVTKNYIAHRCQEMPCLQFSSINSNDARQRGSSIRLNLSFSANALIDPTDRYWYKYCIPRILHELLCTFEEIMRDPRWQIRN